MISMQHYFNQKHVHHVVYVVKFYLQQYKASVNWQEVIKVSYLDYLLKLAIQWPRQVPISLKMYGNGNSLFRVTNSA